MTHPRLADVSASCDKRDPVFHPLPQPKLPDKSGQQPPVTTYSAPEQRA